MNSTSDLISKAVSTRNLIRPHTMVKPTPTALQNTIRATPELRTLPPQQPAIAPPANPMLQIPVRQSVYAELMRKHDKLNPRVR